MQASHVSINIFKLLMQFFYCSIILVACKNNTTIKSQSNQYVFTRNIPNNVKYYYTLNKQTQTVLDISGSKVKSKNTSVINFYYEKVRDSANFHIIKITYDKLRISSENRDNSKELDVSRTSSSFNPAENVLKSIMGSSIYIIMDSKDSIIKVSGVNEITHKVLLALQTQDQSTITMVNEQMNRLVEGLFINDKFQRNSKLLKDSLLSIGDTWIQKSKQSIDINIDATTTYEFKSLSNGIAKFEGRGIINSENNPASVMGYKVVTGFKGREDSNFDINQMTGVIENETSKSTITGTISVLGQEVPIEIKLENKVSAVKL